MSVKSVVEYIFATPAMRHELVFGCGRSPDGDVMEFSQCDVVRNAYKYQRCVDCSCYIDVPHLFIWYSLYAGSCLSHSRTVLVL